MKICYNRKTLPYIFLLTIIFVVEMHFFGLFSLPSELEFIIYTNRAKWVAPVAVILACICWNNHKSIMKAYNSFLKKYLIIVTVIVFIMYVHAIIVYPLNGIMTTYGLGCYYFYAFLAVPIIYIFEVDGGFEQFLKIVNIITIIMYVISIIQGISYMRTGTLLFSAASNKITGSMVRDGKIRVGAGAFSNIMLVYNLYNLYNVRKKSRKQTLVSIIIIILGMVNIYFTGQTRVALLTVFASAAVLIWLGDGSKNKKLLAGIMGVVMIIFVLSSEILSNIWSSFSSTGDLAGSTITRINTLSYYWGKFLQNPIFAIGFAGDEHYYSLVHGNSGIYYQTVLIRYDYTDVGYIGQLMKLGIFSVGVYLWPLFRFIKMSLLFAKNKLEKRGPLLIALVCYLLLTSGTLIILDPNRVIAFPLIIALFEYSYKHRIK